MRILFLYPHPAEDRLDQYRRAAVTLRDVFRHDVVFVHIGRPIAFDDDLPTEHFDAWVESNRARISQTSMIELERRFPLSNLWRAIVAQRTLADYSYVGGTFAMTKFPLEDIEYFLKAVVLFYEDVIRRYQIDVAVAHAPDVIHSQVLYELARSMPFRAINQYYDPYWKRDGRYCVDQVTFASSWLTKMHRQFMDDYDRSVLPREAELEQIVEQCIAADPRRVIATQGAPTNVFGAVRTALAALATNYSNFTVLPVDIIKSYYQHPLWGKTKAWLKRSRNLVERRVRVRWTSKLPARPYVLLALHYQPEAATLACAPVWSDMLAIVRMVSASLPSGFQLVVKDHPIIGGHRSAAFYRAATDLPNVLVVTEKLPTTPLIEGCKMLVTVGGTIGLQALLLRKPVLLFGHIYYDCVDGILRPPADLNDLPMLLKDVLVNGKVSDERLNRRSLLAFMAAYRAVIVSNPKMENPKSPAEQGEGLAELIDHWIRVDLAETAPHGA